MSEYATHQKIALITGANRGSAGRLPSSSPRWA